MDELSEIREIESRELGSKYLYAVAALTAQLTLMLVSMGELPYLSTVIGFMLKTTASGDFDKMDKLCKFIEEIDDDQDAVL